LTAHTTRDGSFVVLEVFPKSQLELAMFTRRRSGRKPGFTLIETVVTVGIIATLAAVVIPQVVRQFDAADPARIQNDLKNLQTAIETFHVNTKAFPGDLDDLANTITTNDTTLSTVAAALPVYTPKDTAAWTGPYVDFSFVHVSSATSEATQTSGYGATILDSFVCYDAISNAHGTSAGVTGAGTTDDQACPASANQKYLALQITGLATAVTNPNFIALNKLFDDDAAEAAGGTRGTSGRVRFDTNGGTTNVVYFLAIPMT
jgi:prepilin-type N-terminal cleavage/methylation domain-containing protein